MRGEAGVEPEGARPQALGRTASFPTLTRDAILPLPREGRTLPQG